MAFLFILKQKDLELACAEAKAAAYGWGWWERKEQPVDGTLLLESKRMQRTAANAAQAYVSHAHTIRVHTTYRAQEYLALTRRIIKVKASCAPGNLRTTLQSLRWNLKGSFKVALTKQAESQESERELANIIWRTMRDPKVDLYHPETIIDIIITSRAAHIGVRAWENTEDFESRRAHLRPEMHPSSMHPGMARALVNISCARSIHDPFCGSGGIVIEAGLSHRKASGADIDPAMIARARKNCAAAGLHPDLRVADAMQWLPRAQAIIADLPYGRNTTPVALKPLIDAVLMRAQRSTARAIIGVPHQIIAPEGWAVRQHFTSYVHKSMTKHFYVLERSHASRNASRNVPGNN
jgi:tRNA (guanine10-N2)-dimethyltransferase